jgi:hypothetical protein
MMNASCFTINKGVIRGYIKWVNIGLARLKNRRLTRVAFLGQRGQCRKKIFNLGSEELRSSAQRVSILAQCVLIIS